MNTLGQILASIPNCNACYLMAENQKNNIDYIPIIPKPEAKVIFIGRDPNPQSISVVGKRGGTSTFINDVYSLVDDAGIDDNHVYITDLCKCHWRTSSGKNPIVGTETRQNNVDTNIAALCMKEWLTQEIGILKPHLIIGFGEELYQILKGWITKPIPAPNKLSATKNKSILDAEYWVVKNGPMIISIDSLGYQFLILRHPGNTIHLSRRVTNDDRRWEYFQKAREQTIRYLKEACK